MAVSLDEWLRLMGREYLAGFIAEGGGAVRIAVAEPEVLDRASTGLAQAARASGLAVVRVDLAATRLHMLQNLFFAVAAALPWPALMQRRAEALVQAAGYRWPAPGSGTSLAALAEANGIAVHLMRRELSQALTQRVWNDGALTQDFRNAMIALLEAEWSGENGALREGVHEWLRGELRAIGRLRAAQIGARIGRQNARAVLMSLCHWLRGCGMPGMVLLIDLRRLHRPRAVPGDGLHYSAAAVMECYEVLRQLIDDAEHFPGLMAVALAEPAALEADSSRAIGKYAALQMRVVDDVRVAGRDNPLAPLVRLAA
jgi:hypothetical protein